MRLFVVIIGAALIIAICCGCLMITLHVADGHGQDRNRDIGNYSGDAEMVRTHGEEPPNPITGNFVGQKDKKVLDTAVEIMGKHGKR